ncbi:MAG: lytic murein transglycosylase [Inquilinus sp.]|nr:lytic murein transglycosylase [Inquilinus sp.]
MRTGIVVVLVGSMSWMTALAETSEPFAVWLEGVRQEAAALGMSQATIDAALTDIRPADRILELDSSQPERRLTIDEYLERQTPDARIERGRLLLRENSALLKEIGAAYGVQPRFIVALWGIETSYGSFTGGYPVIQSLATLAYSSRRSTYFRAELMKALQILDEGHIAIADMKGSWAGAMGQSQFMPSNFLRLAVDHDGDGRRDIWSSRADVFASAANFLATAGWNDEVTWGRQVRVPNGFDSSLSGLASSRTLREWHSLGVRRSDGRDLPNADVEASLVLPDGPGGNAYLVYDNYRVLMNWNRSTYFATTVGILADRIGGCEDGPRGYGCSF